MPVDDTIYDNASLNTEIDKAFQDLRGINDSIKTLTGRTPELFDRTFRRGGGPMRGGARLFQAARGNLAGAETRGFGRRRISAPGFREDENELMPTFVKRMRRSAGGDFDVDAPFEPKPSLASSVVMPAIESKTREAAIAEIKGKEKKEQGVRNRRMFASLVGTLSKFRKDEQKATFKDQEKKQREVETRLDSQKAEEKANIQKQKDELLHRRRDQQLAIKRLQRKRAFVQFAEREETHLRRLQNFIQTQAKPPIFYIPGKHTLRTLELQKNTQKRIEEQITKRREQLQKDLVAADHRDEMRATAGARPQEEEESGRGRRRRDSEEESDEESDNESVDQGSESGHELDESMDKGEDKLDESMDKAEKLDESMDKGEDKLDESIEKEEEKLDESVDKADESMEKGDEQEEGGKTEDQGEKLEEGDEGEEKGDPDSQMKDPETE